MKLKSDFYPGLALVTIIMYTAFYFLQSVLPAKATFDNFGLILLIIVAVTVGFHVGLQRSSEKGAAAFVRFFMGATALKLFLFMMIMIGYSLFNQETAFGFIIHFFIAYLVYTTYEVAVIYKKFSNNTNSTKN